MNFVVLTAALSSVNTNLYLSTRMLFSLGRGGYAPAWMGKVSRNGVPHRALVASTLGIVAAILLAIFAPKNAFLILYGTAVAGMFFVWMVVLITHLRFRKVITRERLLEFAHAPSGTSILYGCWNGAAYRHRRHDVFCRGLEMVGPRLSCISWHNFSLVPAKPSPCGFDTLMNWPICRSSL